MLHLVSYKYCLFHLLLPFTPFTESRIGLLLRKKIFHNFSISPLQMKIRDYASDIRILKALQTFKALKELEALGHLSHLGT